MNGFFWLLIAFPVYLLANGNFTPYVQLLGAQPGAAPAAPTNPMLQMGLNNNQGIA